MVTQLVPDKDYYICITEGHDGMLWPATASGMVQLQLESLEVKDYMSSGAASATDPLIVIRLTFVGTGANIDLRAVEADTQYALYGTTMSNCHGSVRFRVSTATSLTTSDAHKCLGYFISEAKPVQLKDNFGDDETLYPKTKAELIEGLDEMITILAPKGETLATTSFNNSTPGASYEVSDADFSGGAAYIKDKSGAATKLAANQSVGVREASIASNITLAASGVPFISYSGWVPETKKCISYFQVPQSATLSQFYLAAGTSSAPTTVSSVSVPSNSKITTLTMSGGTITNLALNSGSIGKITQNGGNVTFVKNSTTTAPYAKFNPGYYGSIYAFDPLDPTSTTAWTYLAAPCSLTVQGATKKGYITAGVTMPNNTSYKQAAGTQSIYLYAAYNSRLYATDFYFGNSISGLYTQTGVTTTYVAFGSLNDNNSSCLIVVRNNSATATDLRVSFSSSGTSGTYIAITVPSYGLVMIRGFYNGLYSEMSVGQCLNAPISCLA